MKNTTQGTRVRTAREEQTRDYATMPVAQLDHAFRSWGADVEVDADELAHLRTEDHDTKPESDELNESIQHPDWCTNTTCIIAADTGDLQHRSRPRTQDFTYNPKTGGQTFTVTTRTVRYSVIGEDDTPGELELNIEHRELWQHIELTITPEQARDLAYLLIIRANEVEALTGPHGAPAEVVNAGDHE